MPDRSQQSCQTIDFPVSSIDLYPTLIDLANIEVSKNQDYDGQSLAHLIKTGENLSTSRSLYWHYPHYGNNGGQPSSAIREGEWKLITWHQSERVELYNLKSDPSEQNNLIDQQPSKGLELYVKLDKWRQENHVLYPSINSTE